MVCILSFSKSFVCDAENCCGSAPDDNIGQSEIVNVDPDDVRDTDTNIGCNVTMSAPETVVGAPSWLE